MCAQIWALGWTKPTEHSARCPSTTCTAPSPSPVHEAHWAPLGSKHINVLKAQHKTHIYLLI